MGIIHDIGEGPVCLDTSIFIYFIEEENRYIDLVAKIFAAIDEESLSAVTSAITLLETLVIPLRSNNSRLAEAYERLLSQSKGLTMISLDQKLLRQGAYLRTKLQIKTPDALQIAAAQQTNCKAFVTNDRRLPKIAGLKILQLSDYLNVS